MTYPDDMEWQIEIAKRMVRKDHKQRWVFSHNGIARISETAIPYCNAVSVYWMPIQQCVAYTYRQAALAHSSIGAF